MPNALIRKLRHAAPLTDEDSGRLQDITSRRRHVERRQDIIAEGDRPDDVHLILDGFACRYKILPDGRRSIMALLIPGDFCDLHVAILGEMDHGIATLSDCTVVDIPRETILSLTKHHARINRALWWATLVDEAILREWLVNLGQRDADHRLAHLLCELLARLRAVGLADDNSFDLPMTQDELSDLLGISTVHVNRTVQNLREAGLIEMRSRRVTWPHVDKLKAYAGFTDNYLHLARRENGQGHGSVDAQGAQRPQAGPAGTGLNPSPLREL